MRDLLTNEPITPVHAMFAYALIHRTTLSNARTALGYTMDELKEAHDWRMHVCDKGHTYITDYQQSIDEGLARLVAAN